MVGARTESLGISLVLIILFVLVAIVIPTKGAVDGTEASAEVT